MTHNTQILIATERERWLKLHLEGGFTIKGVKVHNLKNIDLEIPKSITKAVE